MDRFYSMDDIYEEIGFGKHKFSTLLELICYESDYVEWMKEQENIFFSNVLKDFIDEVNYGYYYPEDPNASLEQLIEKYSANENKRYDDYEIVKQKRKLEKEEKKRKYEESLKKANIVTDDHIKNIIWNYYSSKQMEEDTVYGNLRWKKLKSEVTNKTKKVIYKAKTDICSLLLLQDSVFNTDDKKWHSKHTFIIDETIQLPIGKDGKASPLTLRKAIENSLNA